MCEGRHDLLLHHWGIQKAGSKYLRAKVLATALTIKVYKGLLGFSKGIPTSLVKRICPRSLY